MTDPARTQGLSYVMLEIVKRLVKETGKDE